MCRPDCYGHSRMSHAVPPCTNSAKTIISDRITEWYPYFWCNDTLIIGVMIPLLFVQMIPVLLVQTILIIGSNFNLTCRYLWQNIFLRVWLAWAMCGGHEPIVVDMGPAWRARAHFGWHEPIVADMGPAWRTWAHCGWHEPIVADMGPAWRLETCVHGSIRRQSYSVMTFWASSRSVMTVEWLESLCHR